MAVDTILHLDRSLEGVRAALDREDILLLTHKSTERPFPMAMQKA